MHSTQRVHNSIGGMQYLECVGGWDSGCKLKTGAASGDFKLQAASGIRVFKESEAGITSWIVAGYGIKPSRIYWLINGHFPFKCLGFEVTQ